MDLPHIPWYRHWWGITSILVGLFVVASFVYFGILVYQNYRSIKSGVTNTGANIGQEAEKLLLYGNPLSPWLGTTTPKVTIVEFVDFACPHCAASFPVIREIGAKYPDQVKIVIRNYPVITEYSLNLALAAFCAQEQDKFWLIHDKLYLRQGLSTNEELAELARTSGLDGTKFGNCLSGQKYLSAVQKDFEDGQSLGVASTPTWYINGVKYAEGAVPRDIFLNKIEELLNKE